MELVAARNNAYIFRNYENINFKGRKIVEISQQFATYNKLYNYDIYLICQSIETCD